MATSNPSTVTLAGIIASDGQNVVINNTYNYTGTDPAIITYLANQKEVLGTYVSSTTVSFSKGWTTAPTGVPANNASNFTFFVNGQYVEPAAIVSFTDNGSSSTLIIDATQLGYSLDTTDTIVGVGKFN